MEIEHVAEAVQTAKVRLVRFLYCDNAGIIRGKATHVDRLAQRMGDGIGLTPAMMAMKT